MLGLNDIIIYFLIKLLNEPYKIIINRKSMTLMTEVYSKIGKCDQCELINSQKLYWVYSYYFFF